MIERLFLVTAGYYPDSVGGAARQAYILAEALGRMGIDVTLVAPSTASDAPAREETAFGRIERFHDRFYPSAGGRRIASFIRWTRWFQRTYRARITPETPVYVFHARLHALGPVLAARAAGAPVAIKLGGGGEASDFEALRAKRYFYGGWIKSLLLANVDAFVANGAQIEADLDKLGVEPGRVAAFPNGVALPPRERLVEALASRGGNRFIFAGRLVEDKRLEVVFEAALACAEDTPGSRAQLVLLGDGPEGRRLQNVARVRDPGGIVRFPGYTADVYPELWKADFFISASMREGQSNALLEAMSAGLIPIIYGASGAADVVTHGETGFIMAKSDPAHFAAGMRTALLLSPERRLAMSLAARQFAAEHIGIDAVAQRTMAMFQALGKTRPSGHRGAHARELLAVGS
ncbi:glycosyltransferase family 4 protein [Novosphingobium resinovorum]|uniref:glycosyltransferase family 4 protein n=1 Tax=Novosphingobium resinovorum TaxID=158500 RepID=UPI002ED6B135|nr:glycosyltransferase family 4 protein [Novosphingobium resinovorum]